MSKDIKDDVGEYVITDCSQPGTDKCTVQIEAETTNTVTIGHCNGTSNYWNETVSKDDFEYELRDK